MDCVRQGHTEYLTQLVDGIAAVIEDELVAWINENGGWVMMTVTYNASSSLKPLSISGWSNYSRSTRIK